MEDVFVFYKDQVLAQLDSTREVGEEEIVDIIDTVFANDTNCSISVNKKNEYRKRIFNDIKKLDVIQELIDDSAVSEIMVNGWDSIYYEKDT